MRITWTLVLINPPTFSPRPVVALHIGYEPVRRPVLPCTHSSRPIRTPIAHGWELRNQECTDPNIEPLIPVLGSDLNICEPYIVGNRPYPVCSSGRVPEVWWDPKWKAYDMAYATSCMFLSILCLFLNPNTAVTTFFWGFVYEIAKIMVQLRT